MRFKPEYFDMGMITNERGYYKMKQTDIPQFDDNDKREAFIHNFDEVKEVTGKLVKIESGNFGIQYTIDTEKGEVTIGTYDVLASKIKNTDLNKFIKIAYIGNKVSPKTKRTYKDFEVYIKN